MSIHHDIYYQQRENIASEFQEYLGEMFPQDYTNSDVENMF